MKKRISGVNQNGNLNNSNNPIKPNSPIKTDNIQTPSFNQISQEKQKDRDIILKTKYSASLKSSAENFLIDLFEKIPTLNDFDNVDIEIPISVAMAIISNISWHQPTEAQVEYDFTRECIDNGLYAFQLIDEVVLDDIEGDSSNDDKNEGSNEDIEDVEEDSNDNSKDDGNSISNENSEDKKENNSKDDGNSISNENSEDKKE